MAKYVRRSIRDLEDDYNSGRNKKPLEDLIRAWHGIQKLPPSDRNSFFSIAGYHGEPFRGAGWGNASWWGGYCNHGNILFPTWHRGYLLRLEEALRTIPGCSDVAMAFWDETDNATKEHGVPTIFLQHEFTLPEGTIPNPLRSYTFQAPIKDHVDPDVDPDEPQTTPSPSYDKPQGYETVRYPFSGLASAKAQDSTKAYNDSLKGKDTDGILNFNVERWLGNVPDPRVGQRDRFKACLNAPNYTVFSNTTSAAEWNDSQYVLHDQASAAGTTDPPPAKVVPLESPHNNMHLAVGGFNWGTADDNDPAYAKANGDMGENDTASFDPIFYFHHCFIDYVFWRWQQNKGTTDKLEIIPRYPGTNSVDNQGPTPGVPGNVWLDLDSPLDPFTKSSTDSTPLTSNDLVNITKLGDSSYSYGHGSLDPPSPARPGLGSHKEVQMPVRGGAPHAPLHAVRVSGINRASIAGSFVVTTWAVIDDDRRLLSVEGVLSRWHTPGCANCQTHLGFRDVVPIHDLTDEQHKNAKFYSFVHTHDDPTGAKTAKSFPRLQHQLGKMVRRR